MLVAYLVQEQYFYDYTSNIARSYICFQTKFEKKNILHIFTKKNVIHRSAFMLFHTVSILSHAEFGPNDLWENASHLNFPGAFFDILVKNVQNICFLTFWISWELILGPTIVYD